MKNAIKAKRVKAERRAKRVRAKLFGTGQRPRLTVKRSQKHIYAQLIDDAAGKTLVAASDLKVKDGQPLTRAAKVGEMLALAAKQAGISRAVVDRGAYKFHGRLKALVEAAVEGGISLTK